MPSTVIGENAVVDYAIMAQGSEVAAGGKVEGAPGAITVVAEGETVEAKASGKQAG
jgi:glucose-1-phosphate adenylyltransferase